MEDKLQPDCYKRHAEIENHIQEGKGWRSLIITLTITIMLQVGIFLQMWGGINKMVEVNTLRLNRVEALLFKI